MSSATSTVPATAFEVTDANREQWLFERRKGVGASEIAAVLGLDRRRSALEVYLEKTGQLPPREPTEAMKWGLRLEPVMADAYEEATGHAIPRRQVALACPTAPFLRATLDGLRDDGRPVELKTAGAWAAREWRDGLPDDIPDAYLVQAQHQMAVCGAERLDVAVLLAGQEFRIYTVPREERLVERIVLEARAFWGRVERGDPPPPSRPEDARLLAATLVDRGGEFHAGHDLADLADAYLEHSAEARRLEALRERAKADILHALGTYAVGILPDGRQVRRSVVEVAERTQLVKSHRQVRLNVTTPKAR